MELYLIVYLYDPGVSISPSIQRMVVEAESMSEALAKYHHRIWNCSPKGHYSLLGVSCLREVSKYVYSSIKDMGVE